MAVMSSTKYTMMWKAGQRVVCDRPRQALVGCVVAAEHDGWVTIACASSRLLVSRYQTQFEQEGWRVASDFLLEPIEPKVELARQTTARK